MIVTTEDIVKKFESDGQFEHFVDGLIRSAGRLVGIASDSIHSDHRTSAGDYGIDIRVEKPHSHPLETFIPKAKSLWSVKSGQAAFSPSQFHDEVLKKGHERIVDYLSKGYSYVWCSIASSKTEQRKPVEDSVPDLIQKLAARKVVVEPRQFEFRWNDTVAEEAKKHTALLMHYFPELSSRFRVVDTLIEWKLLDPNPSDWVGFGDRDKVRDEILRHLKGNGDDNLYYLTGMSGIGKTRLVREACELFFASEGIAVLYIRDQSRLLDESDLKQHLKRTNIIAVVVVDEVAPEIAVELTRFFGGTGARLRFVCIGPSRYQESRRQNFVRVLEGPSDSGQVLQVLKQYEQTLPHNELQRIAMSCRQDLRLALLLVNAYQNGERESSNLRLKAGEILERIVRSFHKSEVDQQKILGAFRVSSSFKDIGRKGKLSEEANAVSKFFNLNPTEFLEGLDMADKANLGAAIGKYFEASPAALAAMVFEERGWPLISGRLSEFLGNIPERLLRKFLERCQDCVEPIRSEVRAEIGSCFRRLLGNISVDGLQDEDSARSFAAWCELDPESGLTWLRNEIESADLASLQNLTGDGRFGQRWGGRRYVVWLCESLARFPEHFENCEIILWNLANNETELGIGNNSIGMWKGLFWPIGTHQSIPFPDRAKVLLSRIRNGQTDSSDLLFNAIIEVLTPQMLGSIQPPEFVGGIMAPEPWMPASRKGLRDALREFGISAIKAVGAHFEGDYLDKFCVRFTDRLIPLLNLDLLTDLRELCQRVENEDAKRKIVANVRDIVASIDEHLTQKLSSTIDEQVRNWEQELSPRSLIDRIRFQTSRGYWDTVGDLGGKGNPYVSLAREIHDDWKVLPAIAEWLGSEKAISSYNLGYAVGDHVDLDSVEVDAFIRDSVFAKKTLTFCSGFLVGRANRDKGLNDSWGKLLDSIVESNPLFCIEATVNTDVTKRGLARFHRAIKPDVMPVSRCVSLFHRADWKAILSEDDFCQLLLLLKQSIERNEQGAVSVALDQVWMWSEPSKKLSQQVAKISLYFLESAVGKATRRDFYAWKSIAIICCEFYSVQVAKVAINWLTSWREIKDTISGDECNAVLTAAAMVSPEKVMNEIGKLMKSDKSYLLELHVFRGLFDVVGVSFVSEWLKVNGRKYIDKIARHLTSPEVDKEGRVIVQPMTEWFFVKFETDEKAFQSFLAGRRSGAVWSSDENVEDKKVEMEKFMVSNSRRLRDWANWEVRDAEWYANLSKEMDEDDERR